MLKVIYQQFYSCLLSTGTAKYQHGESCLRSMEAEVEQEPMGTEKVIRGKQKHQLPWTLTFQVFLATKTCQNESQYVLMQVILQQGTKPEEIPEIQKLFSSHILSGMNSPTHREPGSLYPTCQTQSSKKNHPF